MRKLIAACAFIYSLCLPATAQIDQQEYWRQVDQQRYNEEQQRWANEMAEQARWNAAPEEESYQRRDSGPTMGPVDSMSVRFAQVGAMALIAHDIIYDPEIAKLRQGFWEFHDIDGQYRTAMFINTNGAVSVHGPGGGYNGALLMLWGPNIPAPKKLTLLPVTLKQNEYPATTVKAFNLGFPRVSGLGTLIFVVPSYQALVGNMEDVQSFTATMDGKVVFTSTWNDGKSAAARLGK